jgi:hypothetical protein
MRKRSVALVAGFLLTGSAFAEPIKYTIFVNKDKVGTLISEITGDDASSYVEDSVITMSGDGKSVEIHEILHYGKNGVATSGSYEVTGGDQDAKIKAKFSDDGANVSLWAGDQKDEKTVALSTKTSRSDLSNFWFKKSKPDVGATVTYQTFDFEELKWADVTLQFVGRAKIKVGDKDLEENEIDRTEGDRSSKIYVDEKGDAVLILDGEMRVERQM